VSSIIGPRFEIDSSGVVIRQEHFEMSETMLPTRRHRVPTSIAIAAALAVIATLCGILQLQLSHTLPSSQPRVDDRHAIALNSTCAATHSSTGSASRGCATRPAGTDAAARLAPGRTRVRGARHGA
jgi:hypothetical protein